MERTKFSVVVVTPETKRVRLLPRSKKTSLFDSVEKAEAALSAFGHKISGSGNWRGLVYRADGIPGDPAILHMAL